MKQAKIDREYVLMALCALIVKRQRARPLINQYRITEDEYIRAAHVAIQAIMQGGTQYGRGRASAAKVREIAFDIGLDKAELFRLAEETLRGLFFSDDPDHEEAEPAQHVAMTYIKGQPVRLEETLPSCPPTASYDAWHPRQKIEIPKAWEEAQYTLVDHTELDEQLRDKRLPRSYRALLGCIKRCITRSRKR